MPESCRAIAVGDRARWLAVLVDYQQVAAGCADWARIPDGAVTFFSDHLDDPESLVDRLQSYEIIGIMRERDAVPGRIAATASQPAFAGHHRAALVHGDALVAALETGRIAGAALDVFAVEPLPPLHPMRTTPPLLTTPHIEYVTRETYEVFYSGMVEAMIAFLAGQPIEVID